MNKKYLVIVLSIVAVIVVGYLVFLRKPISIRQQLNQPVQQSGPIYSSEDASDQPIEPNTAIASGSKSNSSAVKGIENKDEGLIIDYHSEVLLNRINPESAVPYSKRELPGEFGVKIFSTGIVSEDKPSGQYEQEKEFKLNAIIIDKKRRIAIINDKIFKKGDVIRGAEIVAIKKRQVVLKINNETFVLSTNSRIKKIRLPGDRGGPGQ